MTPNCRESRKGRCPGSGRHSKGPPYLGATECFLEKVWFELRTQGQVGVKPIKLGRMVQADGMVCTKALGQDCDTIQELKDCDPENRVRRRKGPTFQVSRA